jgi:hypothetical protein
MCERPRPEIHRRGVNEVFQHGHVRVMQVRSVDDDAVRQVASEDRGTWAVEELAPRLRLQPVGAKDDVAIDDGPGLKGHGGRGA